MVDQLMPDTSNAAIGRRLILARRAKGFSQAFFAKLLETSPQRLGNYERGENAPRPDMLARIWAITGASSDYLLFGRLDALPAALAQEIQRLEAEGSPDPSRKSA